MNIYNIQYSPKKKENNIQRIIYNKKIKIYGYRKLKQNNNLINHIHKNLKLTL